MNGDKNQYVLGREEDQDGWNLSLELNFNMHMLDVCNYRTCSIKNVHDHIRTSKPGLWPMASGHSSYHF